MSVADSTAKRIKVGPNLFQKGDRFYLIANVQGRQVCEPLLAANKTEARTARDQRMAELRTTGLAAVGDRTLTFDLLAAKWLEHEEGPSGSRKPSPVELRKTLLREHVSPVLGKSKAVEITAPHLRALIDKLEPSETVGFIGSRRHRIRGRCALDCTRRTQRKRSPQRCSRSCPWRSSVREASDRTALSHGRRGQVSHSPRSRTSFARSRPQAFVRRRPSSLGGSCAALARHRFRLWTDHGHIRKDRRECGGCSAP